jgi:ADP-ribose pyrophosphatase YjhB (NUDIX family)
MNKFKNSTELIVRVIIKRGNSVLLCKNVEYKHYFLPGGHVEFGDSLETTIYKEMSEELALSESDISNISFKDYLENRYEEGGDSRHELNMIFTAEIEEGVAVTSQEEHIEFAWVQYDALEEMTVLPEEIKKYLH